MNDHLAWSRPIALVLAMFTLAACAPAAAPSRTAAPAKPADAQAPSKPAEQPAANPAFGERAIADFYRGKTVRLIVGTPAGGGFDTYSRLIARHLPKYIPGNPAIVVENLPGAGSIVAANQIYNTLPKDGTIIGNIQGQIITEQLLKDTPGVQYDMSKFQYLALPVQETSIAFVMKRTGVTRLADILGPNGKQVAMGGIPGSTVDTATVLMRDVVGANIRLATGYDGTPKMRLAVDSGELDGFISLWQSFKITNYDDIKDGNWVVLAQIADQPIEDLPVKTPTIPEFTQTEEQRQLFRFGVAHPNRFGKVYVMAPEVPADRVAAMEAAFLQTLADQEFLADAEKSKLEIGPLPSAEIRKLVLEMFSMPDAVRARLREVMKAS